MEESGNLGEVREAAVGRIATVTSSGDVLDALWGSEIEARPSDGLGRRPDCRLDQVTGGVLQHWRNYLLIQV